MKKRKTLIATLWITLIASPVVACLWDYDTLAMERQRFPEVLELITGKFLRHSTEFYQWRVEDRQKRIDDGESDPKIYDDLAVAWEKTGNHDKAIEIANETEKLFPGRYETAANLGTFLIHDGELEKGILEIERAIQINPDAHFGREIYQKLLVEYVLSKRVDGKIALPLYQELDSGNATGIGFSKFLLERLQANPAHDIREQEIQKAIKGITGMMRFGNHQSPILLEALGDLLYNDYTLSDGKRLAARAYLKASYEVDDANAKKLYREKASQYLKMQTRHRNTEATLSLAELEQTFAAEMEEANAWYDQVKQDEINWIASGKNPEQEFDRKYYRQPSLYSSDSDRPPAWFVGTVIVGVIGLGFICWFAWNRKTRTA